MESGETDKAKCGLCGAVFSYPVTYLECRVGAGTAMKREHAPYWCSEKCHEKQRAAQEQEQKERDEEQAWWRYQDIVSDWKRHDDFGTRLKDATRLMATVAAHNEAAFATAEKWLGLAKRPNLIVLGSVGSGKSYLAACVRNGLASVRVPVFWMNAAAYMAQVKRGFNDRDCARDAAEKARIAEYAAVLVIDDLGKVHPGKDVSYTEEQFYAIIDARYRECLPTIVTTEWKSAALIERVGESVVSRLEDGAFVAGIKKPAQPYRKTAA